MDDPLAHNNIAKITEDIYKNLFEKGFLISANYEFEMEDIKQEVICTALELIHKHPDKAPFGDGYIYMYAYFRLLRLYKGELVASNIHLYYLDHAEVMLSHCTDRVPPDILYDEKIEEQERINNRRRIRAWLENYGIEIDDSLGLDFALWWQGVTVRNISNTLKKAKLKNYPYCTHSVQKRLHAAFRELEIKTGLTKEQLFQARKLALSQSSTPLSP